MKDLVRLPSIFLLAFLLLFLALLGVSLLSVWGALLPAQGPRAAAVVLAWARLPRLAQQALPAAVLAATLVVLARIAARPGSRLLSLLLPPACAFLILVFGYQGLDTLAAVWQREAPAVRAPDALAPGLFTPVVGATLYVQSLEGGRAAGIVVLKDEGESQRAPRLTYSPRGLLQARGDTTFLRLGNAVLQWPARFVHEPLFAGEAALQPLFADLRTINAELSRLHAGQRGTFYLSCLGLIAALCGLSVLLRLTRWPLLNACLTLIAARGVLALFALLRQEGAVSNALGAGGLLQALPAAGLLLLGALLLLVDLLFVPFDREGLDRA